MNNFVRAHIGAKVACSTNKMIKALTITAKNDSDRITGRQERNVAHRLGGRASSQAGLLILGTGPLAQSLVAQLQARQELPYRLSGCLCHVGTLNSDVSSIGDFKQLEEIVEREHVGCIVVAMSERRGALPIEQLLACKLKGIRVEDGIAFYEKISGRISLEGLTPSFFVFSDGFHWPSHAIKRGLDLLVSVLGLLLTAPLFVLLPVLIKLTSPGPVFYRQERVGRNGRWFTLLKFRSMQEGAESPGHPVWADENDSRTTSMGRFMRKFHLDEFPQFVNVLRGDMSVVGPRPERPEFVEALRTEIPYYDLRHTIKPGVTGWAQVMFRYGATMKDAAEKLQYDLYYIKHMSVALDCLIILRTIRVVLFGLGAR